MSRYFFHFHCAVVGLIMVVTILAAASASSSTSARSGYPRNNRGFRNSQLSTARGFGKRDPGSLAGSRASAQGLSPSNYEGFLPVIFDSSRTNYPTSRLVEELQNNPEATRLFVERMVDENGDGELTPGELSRVLNYY